ncbi:hypothetical protein [Capnocytophaga sp. oral taxon 324]|uniref:hypothetical protein n=1 Tax=Capnocytophaga sp. oral taxon 324 TaxID=712211 RepID=UPI0002A2F278|nr:hypothetical protein [Capnocytophaga sp. oral taxon 324]EKY12703.1 hypothetical protein HMPREF9072_01860 [Capnocytophaga sp. oral taxon 324 str. F0483]
MTKQRYTEKHLILWKDDTWVTCPECQKIAVVTDKGGSKVRCEHCGFEKTSENLELFVATVKLHCPNCGTPIEQRQGGLKEKKDLCQVKCPKCGEEYLVKPQYKLYHKPNPIAPNGLKCDNTFGLPYFFQENVRGNLFWARNMSHLQIMEDYIASDLREREGMTMVAKLPTFVKSKKNRELILKILRKWKEKLAQSDFILPPLVATEQVCLFFADDKVTITNYLKDIPYKVTGSVNYTQVYSNKCGYQWVCFSKYNRLRRTFTKEWLVQIPFEVKTIYLYQYYIFLNEAQDILSYFLQHFLQENTSNSLFISIGDRLYSAESFYKESVVETLPY